MSFLNSCFEFIHFLKFLFFFQISTTFFKSMNTFQVCDFLSNPWVFLNKSIGQGPIYQRVGQLVKRSTFNNKLLFFRVNFFLLRIVQLINWASGRRERASRHVAGSAHASRGGNASWLASVHWLGALTWGFPAVAENPIRRSVRRTVDATQSRKSLR